MPSLIPFAPATRRPDLVSILGALAVTLAAPLTASGQYFGRNKVQYEDLDFRVMETPHFDVYSYERESERAVHDASRMTERWNERLARFFGGELHGRKPLLLYADKADFQQTNAVSGTISETTGGVTESIKDRVILPLAPSWSQTDHVLGHELVHAFQYDLATGRSGGGPTGLSRLPLWMVEGLAEYLSIGRESTLTAMWLRDALKEDDFPTIADLSSDPRTYFPYRFGHAFWAFVGGRWGDDAVRSLYLAAAEHGVNAAVNATLQMSTDTLSTIWRRDAEEQYGTLLDDRRPVEGDATLVLGPDIHAATMNLAPALSPDGSKVLFWSQRNIFKVDLSIADAHSGAVLAHVGSGIRNQHFDGLAFSESSGTWSPDGTRVAFPVYAQGDIRITVARASTGDVERTYALGGIGAVGSLAWSPDGTRIAFAGRRGGMPDLFLIQVSDGGVRRLTRDRYAELDPDWSPDGTLLAFATDRGGGDPDLFDRPRMGIGILDVADAEVRRVLRPFPGARHINPRFAPDGDALYLIADPDAFSDVYRLSLADGAVRRLTRVPTGVTGLTEHAPALSVADVAGDLMFTVFSAGDYLGYRMDADVAASTDAGSVAVGGGRSGALLPPSPRQPGATNLVDAYLADARTGLPSSDVSYPTHDYDPHLGLDYIAQPTAGVSVSSFGTAIGGSVAAYFSDLLGNRRLGIGLIMNGGLKDIGGEAVYTRLGDRFNWGVRGGRIPFRSAFGQVGVDTVQGETVRRVDLITERTFVDRAALFGAYPLSTTRRFEVEGGYSRYSYDRQLDRTLVAGGRVIDRTDRELAVPDALNLFHGSLAFVQDRTSFGLTSPARGDRARLEIEGNTGSIRFYQVLADVRRYFLFSPVTLATRGLHLGRYGADAGSERLSPLFLGFEQFVRGYAPGSFGGGECTDVPGIPGRCPEFDRLLGTRLAVANVEVRLPLFGTEDYGLVPWSFIPIELHAFGDGGVAWTSDSHPDLEFARRSTARVPVFSAGMGARFNVFGRFVLEVYYAYPFQRPAKGGHFGFFLAPGW